MDLAYKIKRYFLPYLNYLFIIIQIALVIFIIVYPFIKTIYYSFTNYNGISNPNFIGIKNYINLFTNERFLNAIKTNAIIASASPLLIVVPLILAVLLFQNPGFMVKSARMTILVPFALSMTAVAVIFRSFLYADGPINILLKKIGLGFMALDWLSNSNTALLVIIFTAFWKDFGWFALVYLAALSNLNQDILDASRVDGANWFQEFFHVIIPQLNPIIVFVTALVLIDDFRYMFDYVFNMTKGGPGYATTTVELYLYREAFNFFNFGYACAVGVAMFIIIFGFTFFQIRIMTRKD